VSIVERLTADDQAVLWPDALWTQEVGALALLDATALHDADGRLRLAPVLARIEERIAVVPRLRQVLYRPPRLFGPPVWVDDAGFDAGWHVRVQSVPAPGGEAQVRATVEQIMVRRLDPSRPLWEMWFLTGLPDGKAGLFLRLHHVVADGIAALATFGVFLDRASEGEASTDQDGEAAPPAWVPGHRPGWGELLLDRTRSRAEALAERRTVLRHPVSSARTALAGGHTLRSLLSGPAEPGTALDRTVGPGRRLALVRADLADMADIAHRHGATVNDVFVTAVAGGVRAWLEHRRELTDDLVLSMYVPRTLRTGQLDEARGNLIGELVLRVPVGIADPAARLAAVAAESVRQKSTPATPIGSQLGSRTARRLLLKVLEKHPVSIATADLVGPTERLSFAGAEVEEVFPIIPLIHRVSVGVGALSYAGALGLALVVDADAVPDPDILARGMRADLDRLVDEAATIAAGPKHD